MYHAINCHDSTFMYEKDVIACLVEPWCQVRMAVEIAL
jgi:hypothetical protein